MIDTYPAIVNIRRAPSQSAAGGLKALYRKSPQMDLFAETCQRAGRPLLRGVNEKDRKASFFRPDCGTWDCPYCARRNVARIRHLIAFGTVAVGRMQPVQFVTLTSHEKLQTPAETFRVLALAWNKLNTRYRRAAGRVGATVYYVQIPETHKSGRWHLHMLCSPPMPLRWWKDNARSCGFGYQCAVMPFDSHGRAGQYMGKYLRKSLVGRNNGWQKSMRRLRRSHNWPVSEQMSMAEQGWTWDILPKEIALQDEIQRFIRMGYSIRAADSVFDNMDL